MRAWLDLYRALSRVAVAMQIQYRASGVIWMLGSIIEPTIYLIVWSTVAQSRGGEVGGFEPRDLAAYYIALMVVNHLTFTWIMHEFQYRIQTGHFSVVLLRPVHPIHGDVADNVAYKAVQLVVMLPAAVLLALAFEPRFEAGAASLLLFVPALLLAFAVRFLVEWALACAAFWTTRVNAINQIYFAVLMFFAGRIAPISLLPGWLHDVTVLLPFYWMVAFPVEVLLGRVAPADAVEGFGVQLLWLAFAATVLHFVWRGAVRRFTAVGS